LLSVVAVAPFSSCRMGQARLDLVHCGGGVAAARAAPLVGARSLAHAHNDYEHAHPLADALAHGFRSVEADVLWRDGRIVVSHDGRRSKGTLAALYLEPLAQRIGARGGSVYGDGQPFYLWIDVKTNDADLQSALAAALDACPFLWRFSDGGERPGAVIVVLTGDPAAGRALVARSGWRPYVRDEERLETGGLGEADVDGQPTSPAQRPRAYSLRYGRYLSSDDDGDVSAEDLGRLQCIIARAHAAGRMVRLWDAPDNEKFWRTALQSGVDFINTDDLDGFAAAHLQ
jgi:hypothetical protein